MQVKDIMTTKVLSVEANTSVFEAIRSMLQHKISGLPVERRRPRWLEFLMGPGRLADEYVHTQTRRVADVMTPDPYTVTEGTPLEDVVRIMEKHRIKRLPVVRGKLVVGIVSRANLLHALASLAPRAPASAT